MELAKKYCTGNGLEIGGGSNNPFPGITAKNVDLGDASWEFYKQEQIKLTGTFLPIDIKANGDNIPVPNNSQDFVLNSHVLEHFENPIKVLIEWDRVIKINGIIFMIVPHKMRTFDRENPRTKLADLVRRWINKIENNDHSKHFNFWITQDLIDLITWMNANKMINWEMVDTEDMDSKVGNGFTIVCRKRGNK